MADRFEREIEDILRKIDDFPSGRRPRRTPGRLQRRIAAWQRALAIRLSRITTGQLMIASLIVMLVSYFFRAAIGSHWVYGLIFGLILFFTTFALSFRNGVSGPEPYYRGRPRSYYRAEQPPLFTRVRDWWRRQHRR